MEIEKLIERLEKAKTDRSLSLDEMFDMVHECIKTKSWYNYLKWEQFNTYELIMYYGLMEDDDTTVWKEDTPEDEKKKGTADIERIIKCLVIRV